MWLLTNRTPFAAERTWVRDQDGAEVWIVAIKGSFMIRSDGKQTLDAEQKEVARVPQFAGQPGLSSLLNDSDLVHTKTRTDIILQAHAYSPDGKPTDRVDVRVKVQRVIDKSLRVHGDRLWKRRFFGIKLTAPKPFTRMPILYERAFGGTDREAKDPKRHRWEPRNPVGTGFATRKKYLLGKAAPNIEDPHVPYRGRRHGKPVGFGAIARHWAPRVQLAGTYDESWENTRSPLLPSDFDERFYQCAPADQQVSGFLKRGETVELYNLTPDGFISFRVPRVSFGITTRFYDGTATVHRADLHTLSIQPDKRRFQIVWHSSLPCHHKVNKLLGTEIVIKERINVPQTTLEQEFGLENDSSSLL